MTATPRSSTPSPPAREQILDAAERLFARKGFDPTTIKEIGAAAKVNPALLYYYFRDKEELYRAVLQRVAGDLVTRGRGGRGPPRHTRARDSRAGRRPGRVPSGPPQRPQAPGARDGGPRRAPRRGDHPPARGRHLPPPLRAHRGGPARGAIQPRRGAAVRRGEHHRPGRLLHHRAPRHRHPVRRRRGGRLARRGARPRPPRGRVRRARPDQPGARLMRVRRSFRARAGPRLALLALLLAGCSRDPAGAYQARGTVEVPEVDVAAMQPATSTSGTDRKSTRLNSSH